MKISEDNHFHQNQELYLEAAEKIFRQLARGGLLLGLSFADLSSAMKDAMLAEAKAYATEELKTTRLQSTLFAVTGITRAYIKDWEERASQKTPVKPSGTAISRVVKEWLSDVSFRQPKDLTRKEIAELLDDQETSEFDIAIQTLIDEGLILMQQDTNSDNFSLAERVYWGTPPQIAEIDNQVLGKPSGLVAIAILKSWREAKHLLEPAKLPLKGDVRSLYGLISSLEGLEVAPKSIAEGMIVAGIIQKVSNPSSGNNDVKYQLAPGAGRQDKEFEKQIRYLGRNVSAHLAAAVQNTFGLAWKRNRWDSKHPKFFEQAFSYSKPLSKPLNEQVFSLIHGTEANEGKDGLAAKAFNDWAAKIRKIINPPKLATKTENKTLTIGIYYFDQFDRS